MVAAVIYRQRRGHACVHARARDSGTSADPGAGAMALRPQLGLASRGSGTEGEGPGHHHASVRGSRRQAARCALRPRWGQAELGLKVATRRTAEGAHAEGWPAVPSLTPSPAGPAPPSRRVLRFGARRAAGVEPGQAEPLPPGHPGPHSPHLPAPATGTPRAPLPPPAGPCPQPETGAGKLGTRTRRLPIPPAENASPEEERHGLHREDPVGGAREGRRVPHAVLRRKPVALAPAPAWPS